MRLTIEALAGQLAERLLPVYLLSGDEPLLVEESLDAVRARARAAGFSERQVFFFERSAAVWDALLQASQALSLFAERRILEVRLPSGKPGVAGAAALLRTIAASGPDLLLLIVTGQLERDTQAAEWVRSASERGAWLPLWPVERARLPQWLRARFGAAGLAVTPEALELLVERSEGNLLAARQEVDKLALLLPAGARVGLDEVMASSADSARFDVFKLAEAVRARDAARAQRILASLRSEGAEPPLVLWALLRELRSGGAHGAHVPPARLIARAARIDRAIKGLVVGDPWDELAWLAAELCGLAAPALLRAQA